MWKTTGRDPSELSLRQVLTIAEGFLLDGRDAQGREALAAVFEDRIEMNLSTGKPMGLESPDPDVRHATKLKMIEQRQKERGLDAG